MSERDLLEQRIIANFGPYANKFTLGENIAYASATICRNDPGADKDALRRAGHRLWWRLMR